MSNITGCSLCCVPERTLEDRVGPRPPPSLSAGRVFHKVQAPLIGLYYVHPRVRSGKATMGIDMTPTRLREPVLKWTL